MLAQLPLTRNALGFARDVGTLLVALLTLSGVSAAVVARARAPLFAASRIDCGMLALVVLVIVIHLLDILGRTH